MPAGISLEEVEETVLGVEGVEEVHELHIWQLSEAKLIASLHVRTTQNADFMQVAVEIKKHLHDRGIHSVTIQPEYDTVKSPSLNSGRVSADNFYSNNLLNSLAGFPSKGMSSALPAGLQPFGERMLP